MKRFSCVSAISVGLVGLSVTTVSFAAPRSPTTVQPSDPTPAGGGTDPTAAPATPDPASETPATAEPDPNASITIGSASGAPGVDAPNSSNAEPAKPAKARRWAGTQIFATTSMTTATLDKSQLQDYNPTVDSSIFLTPRFAFNDAFQLRGRIVFSYEYTNSDTTSTRNEARFSDTLLQLFYRKIPLLPGGIRPAVALNLGLPTSPESRARTMVVAPGASVQLSKTIEHIPGNGSLDFLAIGGYSHPFYRSTTPELRTPLPYRPQCIGGATCDQQLGGVFNMSDSIGYTALVSATWGKWSPAVFFRGSSQWAYTGSERQFNGRPVTSPEGFGPTSVRQSSYFAGWVDYEANSWLTAELGYSLERASLLNGDGTRGNPLWDKYQDQRVYIGANFNIDNIMKQLEGGPTEAGIVRAQNKKPIGQF